MNILKPLFFFIFYLLTSQAHAVCNINVQDLSFGSILREKNKEFTTSGYLSISCDTEDIGKKLTLVFSNETLVLARDSSKEIPIQFFINSNRLMVNQPYDLSVSSLKFDIPLILKITDLSSLSLPGMYSNNISFRYTY